MRILGLSAWMHDSSVCLLEDHQVLCLQEEERFSKKKHDGSFPLLALQNALESCQWQLSEIDRLVFFAKPLWIWERNLAQALWEAPFSFTWFRHLMDSSKPLLARSRILKHLRSLQDLPEDWHRRIFFCEHHLAHAASTYYCSGFTDSAVLVVDGVGEWACTSILQAEGHSIQPLSQIAYPHSLGLFYATFTKALGFRPNSGEYKLMGLAALGRPKYVDSLLKDWVQLRPDGSYTLNLKRFCLHRPEGLNPKAYHRSFGFWPRTKDQPLLECHQDLASSVQAVLNMAMLNLALEARKRTGSRFLCLAGGVALNCTASQQILDAGIFERVFIPPWPNDAGASLGAALYGLYENQAAKPLQWSPYLGSKTCFNLPELPDTVQTETLQEEAMLIRVVKLLIDGLVVGWFQGRMEAGPRALGNRSILADPRRPDMQQKMNEIVKMRESFRPFAPVVLEEEASHWFEIKFPMPYMVFAPRIRSDKAHLVPAVVHLDQTSRIQTLNETQNPLMYRLLRQFHAATACPLLLNTSLNLRGQPLASTVEDALKPFLSSGLDALVVGDCLLTKKEGFTPLPYQMQAD